MYRIGQEEIDAVARVIRSQKLFKVNDGTLQETANFEKELRERIKTDRAVLMTSGTAALASALIGMGIGPGDEVLVPAYTYIATAMAVIMVGAMPVVTEVDETLSMDPEDIEKKLTPKTKAVIPVHMGGYPCDMDRIMAAAKKHHLFVLEDACQAMGTTYKGKAVGAIGDAGAFSFNAFKILSAGEGGAMVTNNQDIFEKSLIYHDSCAVAYFGNQMENFKTVPFCGSEFRTNEITAAILREQLKRLDGILGDLRKNKKELEKRLAPHIDFAPCNDPEGEGAYTVSLQFETKEKALAFQEAFDGYSVIPAYMGKHVFNDWKAIIEKRGAVHSLMDPFRFEANRGFDFPEDTCTKSLELMAKCVRIDVNPDWTQEDISQFAEKVIAALS